MFFKLPLFFPTKGPPEAVNIKESTGFKILDNAGINAALNSIFHPLAKEANLNIEYILKLN